MNLIGLTGGMGSGKSLVSSIFISLGIPVFDSDLRAKELMHSRKDLRLKISELFGEQAYTDEGQLNRSFIASSVFTDKARLQALNQIVHPAVHEDLREWIAQQPDSAPYLIQESAILIEENLVDRFKAIILIVAPQDIRIARIINRDGMPVELIQKRLNNQWPDEKKIPYADYVIYNDNNRPLMTQVTDVDQMIRETLV